MKRVILLIVPTLFLFISCEQEDILPSVENITSGKKWTLQIGSSPIQVYSQLQELGKDKNFSEVGIVYRQPYSTPGEVQSDISLYKAITLETNSGRIERILIQFGQDKVSSIEKGGAMLESLTEWPENVSDEISISINDPLDNLQEKLHAIYQIPSFDRYKIILPDKWLEKPYDTDMENYEEWAFTFFEEISSGKNGRHSVRLYFKNKKLVKIRNEYDEFELVN